MVEDIHQLHNPAHIHPLVVVRIPPRVLDPTHHQVGAIHHHNLLHMHLMVVELIHRQTLDPIRLPPEVIHLRLEYTLLVGPIHNRVGLILHLVVDLIHLLVDHILLLLVLPLVDMVKGMRGLGDLFSVFL